MRRSEDGEKVYYDFKVGNNKVNVYFSGLRYNGVLERGVGFKVNGEYEMDRSRISDEERGEIARKVAAALKHQITQDDNADYICSAYEDGEEGFRALAYTRMGFSRPVIGEPTLAQFAVVKDGKIDPEASRLRMERRERDFDAEERGSTYYDNIWAREVERINAKRRVDRQARRVRNQRLS